MGAPLPQTTGIFEALAESAADAIFTIDERSVILFANEATSRVFGYSPSEVVGRPLTHLIPERYREAHAKGFARYLGSGRRNIPWTGVLLPGLRKDGSEVPLEISFGEFRDEDGRRVFSGFMRDVSERVRAEQDLLRAREAAEHALGEIEAVGRIMDLALAAPTHATMVEELLRGLRRELAADEATVLLVDEERGELVVQQTDGVTLDAGLRIPIGAGVAGTVAETGVPLVIEDTSQVALMHESLREMASLVIVPMRSQDELVGVLHVGSREQRKFSEAHVRLLNTVGARMAGVMARTRLFHLTERRRRRAEQSIRSRDEVLSVVAHDLRNPVATVLASAALLNDPEFQLSETDTRRQLQVIERSARRMNRMIHDLLDVARIEGGRFTVTCRCEPAGAMASECVESYRPLAEQKGIALECQVSSDVPHVLADRDRIIQALGNYIHNAVKFTPDGGRVSIHAERTDEGGVRYIVADTGPGVSQADIPHLFEQFWQSKRTAHMGSGLGLAIVKGIAVAHKGSVGVESAGAGAQFWLELPRSEKCE